MMVLTRYLSRVYLIRLAAAAFAITLFALLFDLLDVSQQLAKESSPTLALATYAALRTPALISEILPIAALLAGLLTASELLRSSELVVMWTAGLSFGRIMLMLVPAGLLLLALKIVVDDVAVPRTIAALRAWGVGSFTQVAFGADPGYLWFRKGDDIVRVPLDDGGQSSDQPAEPARMQIFHLDPNGRLVERMAGTLEHSASRLWHLRDVTRYKVGDGRIEQIDGLDWQSPVKMSLLASVAKPPREMDLLTLIEIVREQGHGVMPTEAHRTWLLYRLASSMTPMLLGCLAFALTTGYTRQGASTRLFLGGIAIGFSFLITNGLTVALGEAALLAPPLAAFGPTAILALIVLAWPSIAARRARVGT